MNDSERNLAASAGAGGGGAAAAAAAAARVSPVQSTSSSSSSSSSSTASAVAAGGNGNNKRKAPSPHPMATADEAAKKCKAAENYDEIKKEIREILEKKVLGASADPNKVEGLRKLNTYWSHDPNESNTEYQEHRRATIESDGCHLVLIALRQEVDKGHRASLQVVQQAIIFLSRWNCFEPELGETMLRFDGVDTVARAMEAFPYRSCIQNVAVTCLHNFTRKRSVPRLRKVVEGGCLPLLLRALPALSIYANGPMAAVLTLGRLCDVAAPQDFNGLVDDAVLKSLVQVYKKHKGSNAAVGAACRTLMNKLLA
jgi:hypothetical protein